MPTALRLAVAAVALVLVGCGAPSAPPEAAAPSTTATRGHDDERRAVTDRVRLPHRSATPTTVPVPDTLKFTSTTVDDRPFDGASLAGKPVLLWFWAPWCPTCRSQIDQVQALARDYEDKVAVIGVGSLDDVEAIEGFAADAPGMTHLSDDTGAVFRHFEVVQQSSFVLLDADGQKVWSVGYGGSDDLADQVAAVAG